MSAVISSDFPSGAKLPGSIHLAPAGVMFRRLVNEGTPLRVLPEVGQDELPATKGVGEDVAIDDLRPHCLAFRLE